MITASALPQAYHCGLSAALSAVDDSEPGRSARVGTAYHARAAGLPVPPLAPDVLEEAAGLPLPRYPEGAVREVAVGLSITGRYVAVEEPEPHRYRAIDGTPLLTAGRADAAWQEGEVAVVGDLKTGELPVEDGPLSLQLCALGFALADRWGCHRMRLGLFYARRGAWEWSQDVDLAGEQAGELWRRVVTAATRVPIASQGPHCESCWQRGRCPDRLLPALAGPRAAELEPFVQGGAELTSERAAAGLRVIAAMREVADRAEEHVRAAISSGLRVEESGKVYGPQEVAGRRTADLAALERDGLGRYVRLGKPYLRWAWRKE